jgi:formylglycine-generating enzyme required for sulfatase activity
MQKARCACGICCSVVLLCMTAHGAAKEFRQPNAYAVVIGISQYREADVIPKVTYAVRDAEAVAKLLETQAGIPKNHIKLLTDSKATIGDIRNHLGKWLQMRVKADSTVYVYYAGHGTPNLQAQSGSMVPWDGHPDFPEGLYPLKELEDTLSKLPTKDVVVFLDSCFSGSAGRSVLAKGGRPMGLSYPVLSGGEVMVLAAASGTQISSDYDKAEHGLFTHYLLTGLQGEADADQDQIVTLRELVPYVKEHVATTAVDELNREQTPVLLPGEQAIGKRIALPLAKTISAKSVSTAEVSRAPTGPSAALSKAQDELKALEAQEQQVEEAGKLATIQAQIEEKKRQIEEKKKRIELAKAPAFDAPRKSGHEIIGKDGAPMVLVPAGEFMMGSNDSGDEKPPHRVHLDDYYIDKYEVTTTRYAAFLQATGRAAPARWNGVSQVSDGERPVIGVDWNGAEAYCRWAGKRLPTEAEWEKAARGTDGRKYPWGNDEPSSRYANFNKCCDWKGYATLTAVTEHDAGKSPYGAYDMAGNVWEWVADWYDGSYYQHSPTRNPTGPSSGSFRVIRGGSWLDDADFIRSAIRFNLFPESRDFVIGFRCAKTP